MHYTHYTYNVITQAGISLAYIRDLTAFQQPGLASWSPDHWAASPGWSPAGPVGKTDIFLS